MKDEHLLISRNPPPPEDVGGLAQKGLGPITFVDFAIIVSILVVGVIAVIVAAVR